MRQQVTIFVLITLLFSGVVFLHAQQGKENKVTQKKSLCRWMGCPALFVLMDWKRN